MLHRGQDAPDFAVPLHTGATFRLRQERGRRNVVLYFYPKDFTFGCTREACAFTQRIDDITNLNAVIIGISPDSLETHEKFASQYHLAFALGSDPDLAIARLYDAVWLNGKAMQRVTYVIDTGGIIRLAAHHELFISSHWRKTVELLLTLKKETQ
jgi:peroxiredoxin Q/BCP